MRMATVFSSEGNFNEVFKYATTSLPQAPDSGNKSNAENVIAKLKAGEGY